MNKLEMAHEYAMEMARQGIPLKSCLQLGWKYADAMQKEWDEREQQKQDKLKQDQQNHHDELVYIGLEEWQPDWSQAPENYKWAGVAADHAGAITGTIFFESEPDYSPKNMYSYYIGGGDSIFNKDAFGYKGKWQDSLRKRP